LIHCAWGIGEWPRVVANAEGLARREAAREAERFPRLAERLNVTLLDRIGEKRKPRRRAVKKSGRGSSGKEDLDAKSA
jgi:hypothetical protein